MNIVGISGLERAVAFKRQQWPGLEERDYRISQGHDAAAALLVSGRIVAAAEEERFDRIKHSPAFPLRALSWCLKEAGLQVGDLDALVHGFDYEPYREAYSLDDVSRCRFHEVFSREALLALVARDLPGFPAERVHQVPHHLAHAASAYYTSGWDECLVGVIDAMGEAHGASFYVGHGGKLELLRAFSAQDSIGVLYSLVTLHLGFDFNSDEYKIMGLAPYGDAERFRGFFQREVVLREDGSIQIPMLRLNKSRDERENYSATRAYLAAKLLPSRNTGGEIGADHRDIAAALQECLNGAVRHMTAAFQARTGLTRLALAGGVALNCTANGALRRAAIFKEIYVQPAAGDDGAAMGAALHFASDHGGVGNLRMPAPLLGPAAAGAEVRAALADFRDQIEVQDFSSLDETCAAAAKLIAEGRVIAWARGRMEFGPRALGNRSILADPGHPEMRDRINAMVKKREAFRPFAPAVALAEVHRWFDVAAGTDLPYMIEVVDVRAEWRASLPSITHVNGSARVQTVSPRDNPDFHRLLEKVGEANGRQMVLNTSFNVKGQPIVNTPREAIETFLGTGIDFLVLENHLISRRAG